MHLHCETIGPMPKRVDHRERRTRIAEALFRVAAERGLEAVSLRHVAAEAGVSSGMVQHYFRTKDEMMIFAVQAVRENVEARLVAEEERHGVPSTPAGLIRALLVQLLPFDETRRVEGSVSLAFLAYAAVRPAVAEVLREDTARMHEMVTAMIRTARDDGTAPATVDPAQAATTLLALFEGLGLHALGGHYSPETALAAFDAHLRLVFGEDTAAASGPS